MKSFEEIAASKQPVEFVRATEDAEKLIVFTARVSNPNNQTNFDTGPKLINYLIKHKHFSPFEMATMTVQIRTSRAIAAQILRHRSFTFQEFSQRYAESHEYVPAIARRQDVKNRQNSIDDMDEMTKGWFAAQQHMLWQDAQWLYKEALKRGVAKECARAILPLSTQTTMYMSGSVRSWLHYLEVRTDKSTQLEHREIAEAIKVVFKEHFPTISEALGW